MADSRSQSALGRLRGEAVEGFVQLVVEGELKLEAKTSESRLTAQLGLSRTPVREALAILSAAGVVERRPQVGVWARRVTSTELCQLLATAERIVVPAVAAIPHTLGEDRRQQARELRQSARALEDAVTDFAQRPHRLAQDRVLQADIDVLDRVMLVAGLAAAERWYVDIVGIERRLYQADREMWSTGELRQRVCAALKLAQSVSRFASDAASVTDAYFALLRNLLW